MRRVISICILRPYNFFVQKDAGFRRRLSTIYYPPYQAHIRIDYFFCRGKKLIIREEVESFI